MSFWGNSIFVLFWKLDVGVVGKETLDDKTGWEGREAVSREGNT